MAHWPSRSLKHEYELYLEREIENYKESVPRSVLLSIADEAVRALDAQQQFGLTDFLLCTEVDRIISKRLRLPKELVWGKRRLKDLAELRRPEHWGLSRDDLVVRAVHPVVNNSHGDGAARTTPGSPEIHDREARVLLDLELERLVRDRARVIRH